MPTAVSVSKNSRQVSSDKPQVANAPTPATLAVTPGRISTDDAKPVDLTLSDPSLSPTSIKETRSYELDRQRSRQAFELAKRREKRETRRASWSVVWKSGVTDRGHGHGNKARGGHGQSVGYAAKGEEQSINDEALEASVTSITSVSDVIHDKENEDGHLGGHIANHGTTGPASREVKLEDMLKAGKSRKANGDFVMIPNPPRVVVLDDLDDNVEDTWEHVEDFKAKVDPPTTKHVSYAQVVSAGGA